MRAGQNAFSARRSITIESLPPEKRSTGFSNSAATSRKMWIDSASSTSRCESWVGTGRNPTGFVGIRSERARARRVVRPGTPVVDDRVRHTRSWRPAFFLLTRIQPIAITWTSTTITARAQGPAPREVPSRPRGTTRSPTSCRRGCAPSPTTPSVSTTRAARLRSQLFHGRPGVRDTRTGSAEQHATAANSASPPSRSEEDDPDVEGRRPRPATRTPARVPCSASGRARSLTDRGAARCVGAACGAGSGRRPARPGRRARSPAPAPRRPPRPDGDRRLADDPAEVDARTIASMSISPTMSSTGIWRRCARSRAARSRSR